MDTVNLKITEIYFQGRRLGIKGALIGAVAFAFADLIFGFINSYLIQRIEITFKTETFFFIIVWVIIVSIVGSAFAYFPATVLGGFLARSLENDAIRNTLTKEIAILKGIILGAIAGITTSSPLLIAQFIFFSRTGHGDFLISIFRTLEATIIASLMGTWAGIQIEKTARKHQYSSHK